MFSLAEKDWFSGFMVTDAMVLVAVFSFPVFFPFLKLAWRTKATELASSTPLESDLHGTLLISAYIFFLFSDPNPSPYFNC